MMMAKKHLAAVAVAAMITMFSLQAAQAYVLKEKISHLQFYLHDTIEGKNVTAVKVASAPTTKTSASAFGEVSVLDDPLTEGPELTSKLVGRAQGLYVSASQEELQLLMAVHSPWWATTPCLPMLERCQLSEEVVNSGWLEGMLSPKLTPSTAKRAMQSFFTISPYIITDALI